MNYLDQVLRPKSVLLLLAGAGFGAVSGLMISEVLIDRIVWGNPEKKEEDDGLVTLTKDGPEGMKEVVMSDEYKKPPLSELIRDYNPNPMESEEPTIAIVTKELVDEHANMVNIETILFYEEDHVFADEDGGMIDDPNELFVPNVHLHFGEGSNSEDIVYIWNGHVQMFYEVVSTKTAYKYEVLGEKPPPIPEKPKRLRRAKPNKAAEVADEEHEDDKA